ncbi:hypothetical protein A2Y83_04640 [Candidatus Falkowbacteria bacterium RBG_13_39_14]|uniref:Fibronectin type-III domain-containing protein n=1 Tax=Candidatus Falkowbacteria bacterium RBG_13_39_14 TaxID=1797985 RepID=A0A1F5S167_9BACT|nr:MAG: hypothetical protein A2Y83_04640 [Candidatus Falkowbacteria bacterium RBG_13_39_14]
MKLKKNWMIFMLLISVALSGVFIFEAKARNVGIFSVNSEAKANTEEVLRYAPGEIIVKHKEGYDGSIEDILKSKKLQGRVLIEGLRRERLGEISGKFKRENGDIINASKYEIPDLKFKAKKFLHKVETERQRRRYGNGRRIFIRTEEFGEVEADLDEKKTVDPYTNELLLALNKDENVEYAQINHSVETFFSSTDPYYSLSWALENTGQSYPAGTGRNYAGRNDADIDAYEGWISDKSNGAEGIIVAVIDTGIDYTHEDFGVCSLAEVNDGDSRTCPKFVPGYDLYNKDSNPMDDNGHGTHCAGIIGALNNEKGIAGVAYNSVLMPVKGMGNDGKSTDWNLANAVVWAVDNGADILSVSWGVEADSEFLETAFKYAHDKGVVSAAAAGNGHGKDALLFTPAKFETVITVGATDSFDNLAPFSNKGSKIDIVAPGAYILSLRAHNTGDSNYAYNGNYMVGSGTSMAAPHAAAAAALVLANNLGYSPEDVRTKLRAGADDLGAAGKDDVYGAGRLNLANILKTSEEKISVKIKGPGDNEILSRPFFVIGSVGGGKGFIENWQVYYKRQNSDVLIKAEGANCSGSDSENIFSCRIDTNGWEHTSQYDIELIVKAGNRSIVDKRTVMFMGIEAPLNLTANGANPSIPQECPEFIINWKYPASYYRGARYKLGSAPLYDDDGIATTTKPFTIKAAQRGSQDLFVWLENFRGEKDFKNYGKVALNYGINPEVAAPSGLSAVIEDGIVALSWEPSARGVYPIIGYNIYKSFSKEFNGVPINESLIKEAKYETKNIDNATAYYFTVQAVDLRGNKSEPSFPVAISNDSVNTFRDLIIERLRERWERWRETH